MGAKGYAVGGHAWKRTYCRNDPLTTGALEIELCGMRHAACGQDLRRQAAS
jgi:hypothetical protein